MDQELLVRDQQMAPDRLDHHQTTPKQQTEPGQQTTLEQEPTSDPGVPRDQQSAPTPEGNEEALHQHQRHLRSSYPSFDLSEISYHTEHKGFPGSRHSSINTEPLTLDADQIDEAKDQAVDVIETVEPEEASGIFTKDLQIKREEALTQETEAQALAEQINTSVEKAQQVFETNEQQQSKAVNNASGESSTSTIEDTKGRQKGGDSKAELPNGQENNGVFCGCLKLTRVSGVVRKSSASGFGKRKPDGDETESELADQDYMRITRLRWSPIFDLWRRARDSQKGGDSKAELPNGQEKNGISVVASSAVDHSLKHLRREIDEGSPNPVDPKAMSLPDELVEKILAMIPFPDILKSRVLNKSWSTNFSSSLEALVFQNQVKAVSAKWKHYCPIILNIEKESLVGYDREYDQWQKMPLRFEREGLSNWFSTHMLRGAGSLMCGVFDLSNVFVTNIVTKTWKWLPSRPDMACPKEIHLLPIGSEAYQVLLITKDEGEPTKALCQIYDSRTEVWMIRRSKVSTTLSSSSSAYLNGVLYVMEYDPDGFHDVMRLLSYNVSDGTWTNLHHPFGSMLHEIETYELLVCQNHVMVVLHVHATWWTTNSIHNTLRNTLMVYKLDPDTLDIKEVARGPPEPMSATCTLFASDNDCIYFGDPQVASSSVVELNIQNREWSCLPAPICADGSFKNKWATFSFQPGMNPFVSV